MRKIITALLIVLMMSRCSDEEVTSREYPRIGATAVSDVSADGASFQSEITFMSGPITDHGFVWSEGSFPTLEDGDKVSLGDAGGTGPFEATVTRNFRSGKTCTMRSYARSGEHTVYGPVVSFTSEGCKDKPVIVDFSPKQGGVGDEIVIEGNFFSARKDATTVKFGDYFMEVKEVSEHQVIVKIPVPGDGAVQLKLTANGNEALAGENFLFDN